VTRARRRAAFSAVAMSVGLSGAVLLALAPLTGSSAAGATIRTMVIEPSQVEGCDIDPGAPCEEPTPVVTVTVTEDPEVPQETVTTTITVPASPKPKPKPTKTTAAPPPPPPQETAVAPPPAVQEPPPVVPSAEENTPENSENSEPQFPQTTPAPEQLPTAEPAPSDTATLDQSSSGTSVYEIRNAGSEFDGATLSRQLGIPALILVLLVLFAVLIFEGRLRRMAHAAAVRRAGPRGMDPMAYPGGPGYAAGPYQGGTAYAPIISFVPMQMYAPVYPEGYTPEQYPHGYDQTTAYMPAPGHEQHPAAGHGVSYDPRTGQVYPVPPGQSPYGPTFQEGPTPQDGATAFQGTSHSGQDSREGRLPQGAPEFPGAPFPQEPARGGQGFDGPRDDFRPSVPDDAFGHPSQDGPSKDGLTPLGREPRGDLSGSKGEVMTFGPETQDGPGQGPHEGGPGGVRPGGDQPAGGERPSADPASTAIYPVPGQETGKSSDKNSGKHSGKKRGFFRRST